MKHYLQLLPVLALLACQPNQSSTDNTLADPITEADARGLLTKWEQALKTKDTVMLGEVLHPTYQYAGSPDGSTTDREAMMTGLSAEESTILAQDLYDLDYQLYEDVAVVRGWEILSMRTGEGDTISFKLRFTDVYKKEEGVTRALATHSSPMD